ncbi:hypothetical protein COW95_04060 [Candidatus Peregrinibacteria bacterium CG22_combo_CG10-13_8_21_14_all_49_11]|nr:MAG: hypothetical protein COW95_04060 [Candidatus Peregrinibacteria bacterium CG22_combo_CG10-13_8_21_14_all_49_11]
MTNLPLRFSVQFADLSKREELANRDDLLSWADWLYDQSQIRINVEPGPADEERNKTTTIQEISQHIAQAVRFISQHFSFESDSWKESPVVWELLSFDPHILEEEDTFLPDALREAQELAQQDIQNAGGDPDIIIEEVDAVIHQVHARRKAIQKTMQAVLEPRMANTSPRQTVQLPQEIVEQSLLQQDETSPVFPSPIREAICAACTKADTLSQMNIRLANTSFDVSEDEVTRVTGEEAMKSQVGDIYLVRSKNVSTLGDHYILIIGGPIQKPHGLRPEDIAYAISMNQPTLLDSYSTDETLILLKLNDEAKKRFYEEHDVEEKYRAR